MNWNETRSESQGDVEQSLRSLLRLSATLNSAPDLDTLLDRLVEQLLELTRAESGCAGLRTSQGMSCSHFFQGTGLLPLTYHCAPGVGWAGWLIEHGTHYQSNDVAHDPVIVPEVRERLCVRSGIAVPIVDNENDVIAIFEVYNKSGCNVVLTAISHDVRAPLAAITVSLSGLLTSNGALNHEAERKLLETADTEARRLHRLVNNLLSMTRLETGASTVKTEPHDLLDVVSTALEELGAPARQRQVSFDIPEDLPLVPMDFGLITHVFINLFSNAFKYSPHDQPVEVRGRIIDHHLEVLVVDRGVGVPPEDLGRVFDKFYRASELGSSTGLGLGLAICKAFIEAHDGRISLENNPSGGTTVRFVIPFREVEKQGVNPKLEALERRAKGLLPVSGRSLPATLSLISRKMPALGRLSTEQKGLDQLTLAANCHTGESLVPLTLRHLGLAVEPPCQ